MTNLNSLLHYCFMSILGESARIAMYNNNDVYFLGI